MPFKTLTLLCLCLLLLMPGCRSAPETPIVVNRVNLACEAFMPLSWSLDDTPKTSYQIRQHNEKHKTLCPEKTNKAGVAGHGNG